MRAAEIDHRLDREEHARPQYRAFARAPDMDDVGLVMEQAAEAMAAEIAHHAHVLRFDVSLDRRADIAGGAARLDRGDAAHHRIVSDFDQAFGAARDFADRVHAAGIAVPAIEDHGDVDIDDVAFAQRLLVRDAVADDVIDRGAGGFAVAAIHQGRGQRAVVHRVVEHQPVDFLGRHAGRDFGRQHVEAFGHELSGPAHSCEGLGIVQLDLAGLARRRERGIDETHGKTGCRRGLPLNVRQAARGASVEAQSGKVEAGLPQDCAITKEPAAILPPNSSSM